LQKTATPAPYMVAPGVHTLVDYWGGNFNAAAAKFTVRADGKVTYDLPFDQVLGGNGTGTLLVKGATITIDARALYTPRLISGMDDTSVLVWELSSKR
jgi:hypothetical protein